MIDKKKLPTDLELAKERAKWELNKDVNKDIVVTLPDGGVYVNSDLSAIEEHCLRNKLKVVVVKKDGNILDEITSKVSVVELKPEEITDTPKRGKK